ncbi:Asp-tRNA(Asn)/Glu-tRNA(Gln) amidotransferase A subunit family amidase [Neolewinella xylanilytica]|uniref:Asp-tRNA(Asn)/Glu-tRNA(Gln) amidotransferase A subunit family amidase n=1 Tax=Neolewinella xylanilytica TaxID=1514080 RepID=A0A2S6IBL2_9BACT|nr:amidase [Neolewinella xylanilytica]PPK88856.1 Asp-tRNA(Asn)/Glu-tRNA(Gln) amidotransferase A subunit family amidase [Neolewinella xylanilytica]
MRRYLPLALLLLTATAAVITLAPSPDQVKAAAAVLGIDFLDDAEIELMMDDLEDNLAAFDTIGKMEIPNGLSPALVFNPVLRPEQLPADTSVTAPATPPEVLSVDGGNINGLEWATVEQLAGLIYNRKITSRELTEFFLARLKEHDPTLHCVITLTEERALAKADEMDAELAAGNYRGYLHGIPYGAKDLLAAEGYPTTWGAKPYEGQTIDEDAAVIEQLDAAGAVLCAKLSMGALAWGDVWFGEKTRNPWNVEQGSSGSSAGSASAVAAGLVPFAIGTETLGSIVSPSTVCGTTGLRPTFGRVSRHGAMALSWSMDKIGPITRSATDAGLVLAAIAHYDPRDAHAIRAGFQFELPENSTRPTRVGYLKRNFAGDYDFAANDSAALETLRELGYELVEIELPDAPDIGFILNVEAAAAFESLTRSGDDALLTRQVRNAWPNAFRTAHFVPAVAYLQANRLRRDLMEDMDALFTEHDIDVYVNPSWNSSSLFITNMTGHPSITVPNGMYEGTPTSITFTGRLFDEQKLVNVASSYQDVTPWDERHPTAF